MAASSRRSGCLVGTIMAAVGILAGKVLFERWRAVPVAIRRQELLDVPVDPLTMEEALERIEAFIQSGAPHHIFTADASGIMCVQDDPELRAIVQQADLVTPDGAGVIIASSFRGARLPERVSGVDLVDRISALAARNGFRLYLFGAGDEVAEAAASVLTSRYPGLQIAGTHHGFFSHEEEDALVAEIAATQPDVLFVALGIPKQEKFIRAHFHTLGASVMVGVGGSFDVIAGVLHRAPRWMQRAGLEWLYRLAQEPARFPRLAALPRFIVAAWQAAQRKDPAS
jgi:N-acetylglucosaminyldiphosphoundecaprenol N-acetyl-beta-D-mannosaminyltransferase